MAQNIYRLTSVYPSTIRNQIVTTSSNSNWNSNVYYFINDDLTLECTNTNYEVDTQQDIKLRIVNGGYTYYVTGTVDPNNNRKVHFVNDEDDFINNSYFYPTVTFKEKTVSVPITKALTHCTLSPNDTTYTTAKTFTLQAESGYHFASGNKLTYVVNGTSQDVFFTANGNDYVLDTTSIHATLLTATSITITGNCIENGNIPIDKQFLVNCALSPNDTNYTTAKTYTITPNQNYHFETTPILRYFKMGVMYDVNLTPNQNGSYSIDTTSIHSNLSLASTIRFMATGVQNTASVPITKTLTNCILSPNDTTYTTAKTFTVNANTGYYFNTTPILRYTDTGGVIHSVNFTLSNNQYAIDTTSIHSDLIISTGIEIVASAIKITVALTNNLPSTILMQPLTQNIGYGDTVEFSLNVDDSIVLDSVYFTINGTDIELTDIDGVYSHTFNNLATTDVISLNCEYEEKIVITRNLNHCTVTPDMYYYYRDNDIMFYFDADNGYIFNTPPQIIYYVRNTPHTLTATRVSDTRYKAYFYISGVDAENITRFTFNATAQLDETQITNKYGCISVFKMDRPKMRQIMQQRFYRGSLTQFENIDIMQFITALKWIYVNVPTDIESNVILGFCDTQVLADLILDDDVTLELGSYLISGLYATNVDINLVESIKVTLPFINDVMLPNTMINHTIKITYNVNVITGNVKAYIYDVVNNADILIASYDGNMSIDVPYFFNSGFINGKVNANGISTNSNLFNVPPKIVVTEHLMTGDDVYTTDKKDLIKNEIGYFRVDHIELNSSCLSTEKQMIESILKTGAFI